MSTLHFVQWSVSDSDETVPGDTGCVAPLLHPVQDVLEVAFLVSILRMSSGSIIGITFFLFMSR